MDIFSYEFFIGWLIAYACYYFLGKKWQWQILTIVSVVFYVLSIKKIPAVLIIVWLLTYIVARFITSNKGAIRKSCFFLTIIICICILIVGRVTNLFALLGNSYFTLKAIGYLIDVYREKPEEKNIFKYLLYLIYWPTVFEGPFNRISDFLYKFSSPNKPDYEQLTHGVQRFIWGAFKKLVIAERLSFVVGAILNDPSDMGGRFVIIAVVSYAIQLYADFSGFMDMMLGVSLTFGVNLPENFKQPYFSKSIPEFWRRWHISLGLWFRDYVMFPFTSWTPIKTIAKKMRKKNKVWGKLFPLLLGTCIVWILTGLWHGFNKNYLIWGMYYAALMCLSQIYNALKEKGHRYVSKPIAIVIDGMSVLKTVLLVLIADTLICVQGLTNIKILWKEILLNFNGGSIDCIIANDFSGQDVVVIIIGVVVMFIISITKEKDLAPQALLDHSPLVVRWIVYYILLFAVLIYGLYGSKYDTSQFLYMQF